MESWEGGKLSDNDEGISGWVGARQARGKQAILSIEEKPPVPKLKTHGHVPHPKKLQQVVKKDKTWDNTTTCGIPQYNAFYDSHCKLLKTSQPFKRHAKKLKYAQEVETGMRIKAPRPRHHNGKDKVQSSSEDNETYQHPVPSSSPLACYKQPVGSKQHKRRQKHNKEESGEGGGNCSGSSDTAQHEHQEEQKDTPRSTQQTSTTDVLTDSDAHPVQTTAITATTEEEDNTSPQQQTEGTELKLATLKGKFGMYNLTPRQQQEKVSVRQRANSAPRTRPTKKLTPRITSASARALQQHTQLNDPHSPSAVITNSNNTTHNHINSININVTGAYQPPAAPTSTTMGPIHTISAPQQEDLLRLLYLQQELERTRTQFSKTNQEKQTLASELDSERAEKAKLQIRLNAEIQRRVKNSKQLDQREGQLTEAVAQVSNLSTELSQWKEKHRQLEKMKENYKNIELEKTRAVSNLKQKDILCRELQGAIKKCEEKIRKMEEVNKQLASSPGHHQETEISEVALLKKRIKTEMHNNKQLQNTVKDLQEEIQETRKKFDNVITQNKEAKDKQISQVKTEAKAKQEQHCTKISALQQREQQLEEAHRELQQREKDQETQFESELLLMKQKTQKMEDTTKSNENTIAELRTQILHLHEKNDSLKKQLAESDSRVNSLNKRIEKQSHIIQDHQHVLEQKEHQQSSQATNKLEQFELNHKIQTMAKQIQNLTNNLESVTVTRDEIANNYKVVKQDKKELLLQYQTLNKKYKQLDEASEQLRHKNDADGQQFQRQLDEIMQKEQTIQQLREELITLKVGQDVSNANTAMLQHSNKELNDQIHIIDERCSAQLLDVEKRNTALSEANASILQRLKKEERFSSALETILQAHGVDHGVTRQ